MTGKRGLGKGLDALFIDNSVGVGDVFLEIELAEIEPDRQQPRSDFDDESLTQLADSIREQGILQPIILRPIPGGGYKIISGERRFRAAHIAGFTSVPAIIKESDDLSAMVIQLIENLQRKDLNPIEEARGFQRLIEYENITQEEVAKLVSKPRSSVTNALRLLSLPAHTVELLQAGEISTGHAKVLLSMTTNNIDSTADRVISEGLSVRELEKIRDQHPRQQKLTVPRASDPVAAEVEISLRDSLGVQVQVSYTNGRGRLSVDFYSKEQLYDFANRLGGEVSDKPYVIPD